MGEPMFSVSVAIPSTRNSGNRFRLYFYQSNFRESLPVC